jgi:predicted RNase H-like HicB family nuclease
MATVRTSQTYLDVSQPLHEAIEFHIEGLKEDGEPIPKPASSIEFIEVAA